MVEKRTLALTTLAILVWAVSTTSLFGYYYLRFQDYVQLTSEYEAITMKIDIYIDYCNETEIWHNNTILPLGFNLLNATELVADVDYNNWPGLGAFIDSIDGVENNAEEAKSWFWWHWDTTTTKWILGEIGADQYILYEKEAVAWAYRSYAEWPPLPPS